MNRHRIDALGPGIGFMNILERLGSLCITAYGFSCRGGGVKKHISTCSCELGRFLRSMWPQRVPALEETIFWGENHCATSVAVFVEGGFSQDLVIVLTVVGCVELGMKVSLTQVLFSVIF